MHQSQLELWSAEPHPTPPIWQQLTPPQRSCLISQLAQMILKLIQDRPLAVAPSTPPKSHER